MSINWLKSAKLNDMSVEDLKVYFDKYPKSQKNVVRICDRCGKEKILPHQAYQTARPLCQSCAKIDFCEKNPDVAIDHGKKMKQWCIDNPDVVRDRGLKIKQHYVDNPEALKDASDAQKKRFEDPKEREKVGIGVAKYFEDPEAHEILSNSQKKRFGEMDDPGQEMVTHHYIYDFSDLDKYTIEVTRSEHLTIHNNLRWAKLQVPCINIMK